MIYKAPTSIKNI